MLHTSTDKSATEAAQDLFTALSKPAPSSPFDDLNNSYCPALFHLVEIFKQATDPDPKAPTIPIPIPADITIMVTQYTPLRVSIYLSPSLGSCLALLRVTDSHLVSTKISPLKLHFSPNLPRHKNPESTFSVAPKATYAQRTDNLECMQRLYAKKIKKK